jgi:methylthioribose-1-phosphate isomerase
MSGRERPLSVAWIGELDGCLRLIDQTVLPERLTYIDCHSPETVWEAIQQLRVRGAPAIGVAAAYGLCLACQTLPLADPETRLKALRQAVDYLASSRPTAVNLSWALERMFAVAESLPASASQTELRQRLLDEARQIHAEDVASCRAIGRIGADLIADGASVLTHCNTGGLATSEYGTALSIVFTAHDLGKRVQVYADETRPLLQGARLTAWELVQHGVPVTLICDSMAAQVLREGRVQAVLVGADRIAANGDTANKIGTYGLAVLARAHGVPFYVAAPTSTFDLQLESGERIPIEQRATTEVTHGFGRATAPDGVSVYNPAFDVTPAEYIAAIVTERGLVQPVSAAAIRRMVAGEE